MTRTLAKLQATKYRIISGNSSKDRAALVDISGIGATYFYPPDVIEIFHNHDPNRLPQLVANFAGSSLEILPLN